MKKRLTITDIASLAGVGKSTVSRYFNGGYVKESTKSIIEQVVKDHNYQPNRVAQSLKAKNSKLIGIIIPTINSTTMSRVMKTLEHTLLEEGYASIIMNTSHNELKEVEAIDTFYRMQVDGIILFATTFTKQHTEIIERISIPVVCIGQACQDAVSVVHGDYDAGYEVGKLIGQKGYKKVAYLGVNSNDIAIGQWRKRGVFDGLLKYDVKDIIYRESDFGIERTLKVIKELLVSKSFDLIVCSTDTMAQVVYKELRDQNLKIPEDVGVVSFGSYDSSQLLIPRLTTIRFNSEEMGTVAANHLIKLIHEKPVTKLTVLNYEIVEGYSL